MKKQPVSIFEWFKACCSSKRVRRKYARRALFKRFTVEELEHRYQKHMFSLRPEEDQAVKQVIDDFKKGWYIEILAFEWIGTFYSPVSSLFTLFFIFFRDPIAVLMPFTYIFCKGSCRKGTPSISRICCMLTLFPIICFVRELLKVAQ